MTETVSPPPSTAIHDLPLPNGGSSSSSLRSLCTSLHEEITAFLQEDFSTETTLNAVQEETRKSLTIIQAALDRYPLRTLSLSYNGGKDCLVLLILYLSLLSNHPDLPDRLPAIYIPPSHPFDSVTNFTLHSAARYHLNLDIHAENSSPSSTTSATSKGQDGRGGGGGGGGGKGEGGMKEAFAQYLVRNPGVEAIFVGTRRTDPHGGRLSPEGFDMTDGGWPRFMRVHPVIEWHYREIWAIPYCQLYDQGYTSLGGTNDTHPNPALRVAGAQEGRYRPAYELEEDGEERLGRDW
ncbi:MAG: hypothetical protein Q9202_002651 [Teloschistes flavicans]